MKASAIDPDSGDHRGNLPQSLSHLALVNAAITAGRQEADPQRP